MLCSSLFFVQAANKLSHATSTEPSFTMLHQQAQVSGETFSPTTMTACTARTFDNVPTCVPSVRGGKVSLRRQKQNQTTTRRQAHKAKVHTETSERALSGSEVTQWRLAFRFHLRRKTDPVLLHLPCVSGLFPIAAFGLLTPPTSLVALRL